MAPKQKRSIPLNDPVESEEDLEPSHENQQDDDDDDTEEGETASSDEGDDEQEKFHLSRAVQPAPRNPSSSKPDASSSDSESESESGAESESDSEPESLIPTPNSKVKPLASKPKEQASKVKQSQASSSAVTQAKSASKRPAENNGRTPDLNSAKKKKKKVESEGALASDDDEEAKKSSRDDSKKSIQRLYSDEDAVAILEGMVEFRTATGGGDPYKCADAFHDFMMKRSKRLSFEASTSQLKEKIKRLKTKFNKNARSGNDGEPPKFSKPHDQRVFELSQALWGEGAAGGALKGANNGGLEKAKLDERKVGKKIATPKKEIVKENGEKQKPKLEAAVFKPPPAESNELTNGRTEVTVALGSMIKQDKVLGEYGLGEDFLRKADGLMEASKRAEFESEWKELEAAELELRVKRAELYADQAGVMLQAIKMSKN